jgi:hypothetical protein
MIFWLRGTAQRRKILRNYSETQRGKLQSVQNQEYAGGSWGLEVCRIVSGEVVQHTAASSRHFHRNTAQ